jgi:hypothetical protein
MPNFEFSNDEIQELRKLEADGYKKITDGQEENGSISPKCLFCNTRQIMVSTYAVDDNKKEVIIYSLCLNCLKKIAAATLVFNVSYQQILNKKIDGIRTDTQEKKE